MLKIRIYAALISIVLTALTVYIAPKVYFAYTHFVSGLTPTEKALLDWGQVAVAGLVALYGFWRWKKKQTR